MRILICFALLFPLPLLAEEKPNIVFILADDLGYGDVGCFHKESKIPTPNLDAFAKQGMRFTDAHSPSSVCSPTRYALLTGRYAWRSRLQRNVLGPFAVPLIGESQLTVPKFLKQQGYATHCVGKWHLGWDWMKPGTDGKRDWTQRIPGGPTTRGFDTYFGTDVPNYPPFCFIENDRTVGIPSEAVVPKVDGLNIAGLKVPGWKLVEILPELERRAVKVVEDSAKVGKPFFLYLPLTSPHYPVVPAPAYKGKSGVGDYGDFVMQTDAVVGSVLEALKRNKLDGNTLVIFTSDNGPEVAGEVRPGAYDRLKQFGHGSMGPLRGVKRDLWEGGHRVPFIARWPGVIPADSESSQLICHVDLLATLAKILDAKLPEDAAPDSVNILPALTEPKLGKPLREAIVHHSASGRFAIRKGDYVLIVNGTGDDNAKNGEPAWLKKDRGYDAPATPGELYNVASDRAEAKNLYSSEPAKVKELTELLEKYVTEGRSTPGPKLANDVAVEWRGKK